MKKILALFIALQLISNHEAFAEMLKLPFLFHHYSETAANTSIIDFLKTHYSENQHEDSDHDHNKLPFKHADDGCSNHPSPVISVVIQSESDYIIKPFVTTSQKIVYSNDRIPNSFINNIWQPPKLV